MENSANRFLYWEEEVRECEEMKVKIKQYKCFCVVFVSNCEKHIARKYFKFAEKHKQRK